MPADCEKFESEEPLHRWKTPTADTEGWEFQPRRWRAYGESAGRTPADRHHRIPYKIVIGSPEPLAYSGSARTQPGRWNAQGTDFQRRDRPNLPMAKPDADEA